MVSQGPVRLTPRLTGQRLATWSSDQATASAAVERLVRRFLQVLNPRAARRAQRVPVAGIPPRLALARGCRHIILPGQSQVENVDRQSAVSPLEHLGQQWHVLRPVHRSQLSDVVGKRQRLSGLRQTVCTDHRSCPHTRVFCRSGPGGIPVRPVGGDRECRVRPGRAEGSTDELTDGSKRPYGFRGPFRCRPAPAGSAASSSGRLGRAGPSGAWIPRATSCRSR